MRRTRELVLARETLRALGTEELAGVAGAAGTETCTVLSCGLCVTVGQCLTDVCTDGCFNTFNCRARSDA